MYNNKIKANSNVSVVRKKYDIIENNFAKSEMKKTKQRI
jgi:hypothetical protein